VDSSPGWRGRAGETAAGLAPPPFANFAAAGLAALSVTAATGRGRCAGVADAPELSGAGFAAALSAERAAAARRSAAARSLLLGGWLGGWLESVTADYPFSQDT